MCLRGATSPTLSRPRGSSAVTGRVGSSRGHASRVDVGPPSGAQPVPERMPLWVRVWYRLPLVDPFAHEWMWSHGGFLVFPPDHPYSVNGWPDEDDDD